LEKLPQILLSQRGKTSLGKGIKIFLKIQNKVKLLTAVKGVAGWHLAKFDQIEG